MGVSTNNTNVATNIHTHTITDNTDNSGNHEHECGECGISSNIPDCLYPGGLGSIPSGGGIYETHNGIRYSKVVTSNGWRIWIPWFFYNGSSPYVRFDLNSSSASRNADVLRGRDTETSFSYGRTTANSGNFHVNNDNDNVYFSQFSDNFNDAVIMCPAVSINTNVKNIRQDTGINGEHNHSFSTQSSSPNFNTQVANTTHTHITDSHSHELDGAVVVDSTTGEAHNHNIDQENTSQAFYATELNCQLICNGEVKMKITRRVSGKRHNKIY